MKAAVRRLIGAEPKAFKCVSSKDDFDQRLKSQRISWVDIFAQGLKPKAIDRRFCGTTKVMP
jgi:hypothetical protein